MVIWVRVTSVDSHDTFHSVDCISVVLLGVRIAATIHRPIPAETGAGRSEDDARVDLAAVLQRLLERFHTIDGPNGARATLYQYRAEGEEGQQNFFTSHPGRRRSVLHRQNASETYDVCACVELRSLDM